MAGKIERNRLTSLTKRAHSRMERESLRSSQSVITAWAGSIRTRMALVGTR